MAGTIIADYIRTDANKLSLNVGNTTFATINAMGLLSNTGVPIIAANGTVATSALSGTIATGQIADAAITRAKMGYAGSVLQVVSTIKTDTDSFNNTSFNTIPGLSVSITPTSSSSKILIITHIHYGAATNAYPAFRLYRDSTWVGQAQASGGEECSFGHATNFSSSEYRLFSSHYTYLDSPSTASSITYTVQASAMRTSNQQIYINRAITLGDENQLRATSTITAMEIAG